MIRVLSLFTGIGGLDYGFEAAGFRTVAAVDVDPRVVAQLRANRSWAAVEADVTQLSPSQLLRATGLQRGRIDMIIAGPPCQPYSKASYWRRDGARRLDDPRAKTLDAFLGVVAHTLPQALLLENVPGFAFRGKAEGLEHVLSGMSRINARYGTRYAPVWAKLNTAHYGIPQMRERVFLVASRDGTEFAFPTPTHSSTSGEAQLPYHTCWDALGDLSEHPGDPSLEVRGKWADLLPSIPEGQNYLWHTNRGGGEQLFGWRTRYWSFLLKLAKTTPSWTIQSQTGSAIGPFHWTNRKLSAKELMRLQTFPDDIFLDAGRVAIQGMIGNAVPSLMAEVLAREIRRQFFNGEGDRKAEASTM